MLRQTPRELHRRTLAGREIVELGREILQLLVPRACQQRRHVFEDALDLRLDVLADEVKQSVVPDLTDFRRTHDRRRGRSRSVGLQKLEGSPVHFVLDELEDAGDVVVVYVRHADDVDLLIRRAQRSQDVPRVLLI